MAAAKSEQLGWGAALSKRSRRRGERGELCSLAAKIQEENVNKI